MSTTLNALRAALQEPDEETLEPERGPIETAYGEVITRMTFWVPTSSRDIVTVFSRMERNVVRGGRAIITLNSKTGEVHQIAEGHVALLCWDLKQRQWEVGVTSHVPHSTQWVIPCARRNPVLP